MNPHLHHDPKNNQVILKLDTAVKDIIPVEVDSDIKHIENVGITKGKKDLSVRYDVINKTLVRAIKRYYSKEVGIASNNLYSLNSDKMIEWCERIDEVTILF